MKQWFAKIIFLTVLLLFLIPGHYEVAYVSSLYHRYPLFVGLLVAALLGGFGWWLRRQTEMKIKDPVRQ